MEVFMNINELINIYENSNINEEIKNKRILILNTKLSKDQLEYNLKYSINQFVIEFNSSEPEYNLEPNLKHMLILIKGYILESDFCKNINKNFTIDELEQIIYQEELKGENLDYLKLNIKLYKMLDNINEQFEDLKSMLENTINIVLDENINNLDNYLQSNVLDDITYNLLNEFINYQNKSLIIS